MREKRLITTAFAMYLLLLVWLVMFKLEFDFTNLPRYRQLILIPFSRPGAINLGAVAAEIVWNVIAFIPLGLYLSALEMPEKTWKRVLIGFGLSLVFEVLQYAFAVGTSDVTDLINNTLGTAVGVLLFLLIKKILKERAAKVTTVTLLILQTLAIAGYAFLYFVNI